MARFDRPVPVWILTHNDADGLAAAALLARAFLRLGVLTQVRILGRGENPWSEAIGDELRAQAMGGLIVTDLGVRPGPIRPETPTIIIDHHVPLGASPGATVISAHGETPTPTSSLLAFWCAEALTEVDDLLWIAAFGNHRRPRHRAEFEELPDARRPHGATALRQATTLINAPRRAAAGRAACLRAPDQGRRAARNHERAAPRDGAARARARRGESGARGGQARGSEDQGPGRAGPPRFALPDPSPGGATLVQPAEEQHRDRRQHRLSPGLGAFQRPQRDGREPDRFPAGESAVRRRRRLRQRPRAGDRRRALPADGWNEFVERLGFGSDMQVGA